MKNFVDKLKNKKYLFSVLSAFCLCALVSTISCASGESVSSSVTS